MQLRKKVLAMKKRRKAKVSTTKLTPHDLSTLQEIERDHIEKVLTHVNHNRTRAAEILGIDRVSLWRKIKRYEASVGI